MAVKEARKEGEIEGDKESIKKIYMTLFNQMRGNERVDMWTGEKEGMKEEKMKKGKREE